MGTTAKLRTVAVHALLALALVSCSDSTGLSELEQFTWGPADPPENVVEGIDVSVALGDIFILGQFNTPTPCYTLTADLSRSGSRLTLRVKAQERSASNCSGSIGGYRYTAVIRNVEQGKTYQLEVTHDVGGQTKTFTESVQL